MTFQDVKERGRYLLAETIHQLIVTLSPDLVCSVWTRRQLGIGSTLLGTMKDDLDNITLYDESILYGRDEDKYKKNSRYQRIFKSSHFRVYFDTKTNYFIILPVISKFASYRIIRDLKKINEVRSFIFLEIAYEFCDQLLVAYEKIAERYTRDMAIYGIDGVAGYNTNYVICTMHDIADTMNIVSRIIFKPAMDLDIKVKKWRPERILTQKSLSILYSAIMHYSRAHQSPVIICNNILIDPLILVNPQKVDSTNLNHNEVHQLSPNDISCMSYKCEVDDDCFIMLEMLWRNILCGFDGRLYTAQFALMDSLIDSLPAQIIAIEMEQYPDRRDVMNISADIGEVYTYLKKDQNSSLKNRILVRAAEAVYDDIPHLYDLSQIITIANGDKVWYE